MSEASPRYQVVVPCYNEAARLDTAAFADWLGTHADWSFRFVDDGSTDGTKQVLHAMAQRVGDRQVKVTALGRNVGKAGAVYAGVRAAMDDGCAVCGYFDADLATPLDELPALAALLAEDPGLRLVLASRVLLIGRQIERKVARHYAGRIMATLATAALGLRVYDTQCGAKLIRVDEVTRRAFATPFCSGWTFDVELIDRLMASAEASAGHRLGPETVMAEHPVRAWRDVDGSKVTVTAGVRALRDLWRIRQIRRRRQNQRGGSV